MKNKETKILKDIKSKQLTSDESKHCIDWCRISLFYLFIYSVRTNCDCNLIAIMIIFSS